MGKFIEVYDDVISPKIQDVVEDFLLGKNLKNKIEGIPWTYVPNVSDQGNNSINELGFAYNFKWLDSCNKSFSQKYNDFLLMPLYNFCIKKDIIIYQVNFCRTFLIPPSISPGPQSIHKDYPHLDIVQDVCLYYVNDSDGDTIFYDENETEVKRVTPKKGRVVFFDGSYYHSASSPSKNTRVILNYNFSWYN